MFTDPIKNLKQFELKEDMIVADLGAGTGFYAIALSHIVPKGKVYAVEVVPDYLKTIQNKIKDANLTNVECFLGDVEKLGGTKLAEGVIDAVVASNIFFQLEDRVNFLEEVKRILAPLGRVLLIDWADEASLVSPHKKMIIPKNKAREMFEQNGFKWIKDIDAREHHYGMIFDKIKT